MYVGAQVQLSENNSVHAFSSNTRSTKRYTSYCVKQKVSKGAEKKAEGANKEHAQSLAFHLEHTLFFSVSRFTHPI